MEMSGLAVASRGLDGNAGEAREVSGNELPGAVEAPESRLFARRVRLLDEIRMSLGAGEIVLVRAPACFGKSSLLRQCVAVAREDSGRGVALSISLLDQTAEQAVARLDAVRRDVIATARPLVAIDDIPPFEGEEAEALVRQVGKLRQTGFEVIVALSTACRSLMAEFLAAGAGTGGRDASPRDAGRARFRVHAIEASELCVEVREYATWARRYAISSTLDVYELTLGIPALVAALATVTSGVDGRQLLEDRIKDIYGGIIGEFRSGQDRLFRIICLFVLLGRGFVDDLAHGGIIVKDEQLDRLAREYPVFRIDREERTFQCLGDGTAALREVRRDIGNRRPALAERAMKVQAGVGDVDRATELANMMRDGSRIESVLRHHPLAFSFAGHVGLVRRVLTCGGEQRIGDQSGVDDLLALLPVTLFSGEYRLSRAICAALAQRVPEVERAISSGDWSAARAVCQIWGSCKGISLPDASCAARRTPVGWVQRALQPLAWHAQLFNGLIGGDGEVDVSGARAWLLESAQRNKIDVPRLLLSLDVCLDETLHDGQADLASDEWGLEEAIGLLTERRLIALAARVRAVLALRRVMAGMPVADERAFGDAGVTAVRESNRRLQMLCLIAEGWQAIGLGQVANAQFRAQQVLRSDERGCDFLRSWAALLECTASVLGSSRVVLHEEALTIDLDQGRDDPGWVWTVAIRLAAGGCDADLSAWCSMHKASLLDDRYVPLARLALFVLGERVDALWALIPRNLVARYRLVNGAASLVEAPDIEVVPSPPDDLGQMVISLLGGFRVVRNGHELTDVLWKRKKAGRLAARLALGLGAFVSRSVLMDEMWPDIDYRRSRENLYVTLSALRAAFRQTDSGPQYVVTQGDGIGLNSEYVTSDVKRFDRLARRILLRGGNVPAHRIMEDCIDLEKIYRGPVFVPDIGNVSFFTRARREFASKFVDCMVRGIDVSIDEGDLASASWLVEATLRQDPTREDVVRRAMVVYGLAGRRREVAELYGAHLYYLKNHLNSSPDIETIKVYQQTVGEKASAVYM